MLLRKNIEHVICLTDRFDRRLCHIVSIYIDQVSSTPQVTHFTVGHFLQVCWSVSQWRSSMMIQAVPSEPNWFVLSSKSWRQTFSERRNMKRHGIGKMESFMWWLWRSIVKALAFATMHALGAEPLRATKVQGSPSLHVDIIHNLCLDMIWASRHGVAGWGSKTVQWGFATLPRGPCVWELRH